MLRVVVAAPPVVREPQDLDGLPRAADLVELRLDLLDPEGAWSADLLARFVAAAPRPVLATVRSRREGGAFGGTPAEAAARLTRAAAAGASWVDVEVPVAPHLEELPSGVRVVLSHHGEGDGPRPEDLGALARRVEHVKIARSVDDRSAYERLGREAREAPSAPPRTFVPFGRLGPTRGLFVKEDAPGLLYGAADLAAGVVRGQPSLGELLDELRAGEMGPDAALYGLLGRPPTHSPSPAIHNAAFRRLGRNALYVALPGVTPEEALELPFEGFSVTTPYKVDALALAEADALTAATGAANTLVRAANGGASWTAWNTDAWAISALVLPNVGGGAFVYGAGGYARAAVLALRGAGYAVRLGARDEVQGRAAAEEVGAAFDGATYRRRDEDLVVVNATPLGVDGRVPAPFADTVWTDLVLLDAPYASVDSAGTRRMTGLVRAARAGGASRVVDGTTLLRAQANYQVGLFNTRFEGGVEPDVSRLALEAPPPLLLLGLRGAGKSTVGPAVARRLGRPFVDLDREVERVSGRTAGDWIRGDGVDAFRQVEVESLDRLVGRRGVVAAAGGGVLEHPKARSIVREHMTPCLLDVTPEIAAARVRTDLTDRPSLVPGAEPEEEARRLHAARLTAWREVAVLVVDANGSVNDTRDHVVRAWTTLHGCEASSENGP